jgi:hypothetical protein
MSWYKKSGINHLSNDSFFYHIKKVLEFKMEEYPNLTYRIRGASNTSLYFDISTYGVVLKIYKGLYTLVVSNNKKTLITEKENILTTTPYKLVSRILETIENDKNKNE